MHQIASTLLSLVLSPIDWIILLVILSFCTKSGIRKRRYRISALVTFLLFTNSWLVNSYARFWQPVPRDMSKDSSYSCGILLGGFGSPDENDNGYFNSSADRFIQTVKLYKTGKIRHILVSGGNVRSENKDFNEGRWTKSELLNMGIPDSVIFYEDQSSNTAENATNSKRILDSSGLAAPFLLITSAHHIPRASLLFKNDGLTTIAYPCSYIEGREKYRLSGIIPQLDNLFRWEFYMKETVSYWIYKIRG